MEEFLFDQVGEAMRTLVPAELGTIRLRPRRWALKLWFGPADPTREHYEAQILGAQHLPAGATIGIEIGFHAEHTDPADNDACIARLTRRGGGLRTALGRQAEVGGFIGRPDQWRRVSEVWVDPDLGDPELPWEIATRLTDYVLTVEPLRGTTPAT